MKKLLVLFAAILATMTMAASAADDDHAYTFGPVVVVSFVRTQPGMFEEYLRYLDNTYKKVLEEYKKQGIILEYAVYGSRPRDAQDADLVLTVKYKNMAAFDDLQSRTDPIAKQVFGSLSKAASASADRDKLRKDLGSQELRQLILK
jgi:Skp family chaperone for outer membrane proteins